MRNSNFRIDSREKIWGQQRSLCRKLLSRFISLPTSISPRALVSTNSDNSRVSGFPKLGESKCYVTDCYLRFILRKFFGFQSSNTFKFLTSFWISNLIFFDNFALDRLLSFKASIYLITDPIKRKCLCLLFSPFWWFVRRNVKQDADGAKVLEDIKQLGASAKSQIMSHEGWVHQKHPRPPSCFIFVKWFQLTNPNGYWDPARHIWVHPMLINFKENELHHAGISDSTISVDMHFRVKKCARGKFMAQSEGVLLIRAIKEFFLRKKFEEKGREAQQDERR